MNRINNKYRVFIPPERKPWPTAVLTYRSGRDECTNPSRGRDVAPQGRSSWYRGFYPWSSIIFTVILFSACGGGVNKSSSCLDEPLVFQQSLPKRVCFKEHCFEIELALSSQERARGLMYREHLDNDKGMLFVYKEEGLYNFWMKNTIIPLDMMWISPDKEVVFIARDVKPCKDEPCPVIYPGSKAMYVLELNANSTSRIHLEVGDKLRFE